MQTTPRSPHLPTACTPAPPLTAGPERSGLPGAELRVGPLRLTAGGVSPAPARQGALRPQPLDTPLQ